VSSSALLEDYSTTKPLWAGRSLAVISVILVAFNLRTSVTAMSAIIVQIGQDIVLTDTALGIIGMLPPLMLATGGLLGPVLARWVSLELNMLASLIVMIAGHIMRSIAEGFPGLLIGSIIAMLGMGVGNVLLPALVKQYFPDRIALMTSLYAMLFSVSTATPGAVAPAVAEAYDWRAALVIWALIAAVAVPPWLGLWIRHWRRQKPNKSAETTLSRPQTPSVQLWRSRTAWGLLLMYGLSSLNGYAMLAWLPEILLDTTAVSSVEAGFLLSTYAVTAGPLALIVPAIAIRLRNPGVLAYVGAATFIIGYLGLMFVPEFLTPMWVLVSALGTGLFPVMLALINARTRTPTMTAALSGFVQGLGALVSVAGPLIVGILRDFSGGWTLPYVFLMATAIGVMLGGLMLRGSGYVDDEVERQEARTAS